MKVTLWGTRGSVAAPGPETERYGGNTSCVEVRGEGGVLVLDAGTGMRRLGGTLRDEQRVDVLLTHLHMDHIQGLGFFAPLFNPRAELHIWGPATILQSLRERLTRYLGPPLFPVSLRDVETNLRLHEVPRGEFRVGEFRITSDLVCHPGMTVGYRIESNGSSLAYLPDHEPALGSPAAYLSPDWTSGYALARGASALIHDAQYTADEYASHAGWGHSSVDQAVRFARLAEVERFIPFHHDPSHDDDTLDKLMAQAGADDPPFTLIPGMEGTTIDLS